jgi:hypothetical protein
LSHGPNVTTTCIGPNAIWRAKTLGSELTASRIHESP